MEALLVGSREDVPQALSDDFRLSGSLHILALSGLHVTALYGAVALLLGFVRSRAAKFVLATAVLAGYQALAGFLPSLLRATVMIVVGGTAHMLDRDAEPLNVLALSGIVLLAIDPFAAFSVSFQLSFLAMAGILVIGPVVERPLEGILPRAVRVPLAMAIGAQAGTLPVVIAAFGAWYPSGIPAGLLLVPLTTVLLWAGVAWLPISALPLPALHEAGSRVLGALYAAVEQVAAFFARAPGVAFPSPAATWAAAAAAVLLAAAMLVLPWRPRGPQLPTGRPA
jgi:competence protein ComEC